MSIFKKLYFFNQDILPKYSNEQKRVQRLEIINHFLVIALLVFFIYDIVLAVLKYQAFTFEKFPVLIFWLLSLLSFYLTKKGKYLPAKLIVIFTPLLFISVYSLTGYVIGEHFLWQPIMVLGMSIIPFLILDVQKERVWLLIAFLSFLIYIIFHDKLLLYGSEEAFIPVFDKLNTTPLIYSMVRIIVFFFLTSIIYYSVRLNDNQQLLNEMINRSLIKTSSYLETVNSELEAHRNATNNSASLLIMDDHRDIISVNDSFLSVSGFTIEELKGINLLKLSAEYNDENISNSIEEVLDTGEVWRGELKIKKKNNEFFWMQVAISPIKDSEKKQKGFLSIMFDISRLKDDEERLEKLNFEKDRILYAVAHDLKNPLLNFKSLLGMLKSGALSDKDEEEVFRLMTRDCEHATNLIEELLEIGRFEDEGFILQKAPSDLNAFLEKSLSQFKEIADKKNISLTKTWENNLKPIKIHEKEFDHVVYNLISNAIKFTPAGGEIEVKTKIVSDDKVSIEVSDTGIGISQKLLPIIFDKFSKAGRMGIEGEKSTGLGMWIVKHIVQLHDGEIAVRSQVDKGTTFTILLPIA